MTIIYVTKYALTRGIFAIRARIDESGFAVQSDTTPGYCSFTAGRHSYALTQEEAVAMAEKMRQAKLKSLAKSVEKIKAIDFTGMVAQADGELRHDSIA